MRGATPLRLAAAWLVMVSLLAAPRDAALAPALAKPVLRLARRVSRFNSLTGAWSGAYRYPSSHIGVDAVAFNARIEETGEHFTGDIDEPNTYADPSAPRLFAQISGTRKGLEVSFVKQMDGTGGVSHSIRYDGTADPDLSRIEGRWFVHTGWSGTFFMERAGVEAEAAVSRAAGATE